VFESNSLYKSGGMFARGSSPVFPKLGLRHEGDSGIPGRAPVLEKLGY
jgi:hypothetical protein